MCVSIEREKSVYKERKSVCLCVEREKDRECRDRERLCKLLIDKEIVFVSVCVERKTGGEK